MKSTENITEKAKKPETKKATGAESTTETKKREAKEATEAAKTAEVRVDYILPFLPGTREGDAVTVTVNGKNYQVMYGKKVNIPFAVYDILEGMVRQTYAAEAKARRLSEREEEIARID